MSELRDRPLRALVASAALVLLLAFAGPARAAGPRIALVHGLFGDASTFGSLAQFLHEDLGADVDAFVYASGCQRPESIEAVAAAFADWLAARFPGAEPPVDVVAHSMGGLVARAYMAGLAPGRPYGNQVRRLIMLATPNYGLAPELIDFCSGPALPAPDLDEVEAHAQQLRHSSRFVWALHEAWGRSDFGRNRQHDTLTAVGNGDCCVRAASAALPPDGVRHRVLGGESSAHSGFQGIANIGSRGVPAYGLVRGFLGEGTVSDQDPGAVGEEQRRSLALAHFAWEFGDVLEVAVGVGPSTVDAGHIASARPAGTAGPHVPIGTPYLYHRNNLCVPTAAGLSCPPRPRTGTFTLADLPPGAWDFAIDAAALDGDFDGPLGGVLAFPAGRPVVGALRLRHTPAGALAASVHADLAAVAAKDARFIREVEGSFQDLPRIPTDFDAAEAYHAYAADFDFQSQAGVVAVPVIAFVEKAAPQRRVFFWYDPDAGVIKTP